MKKILVLFLIILILTIFFLKDILNLLKIDIYNLASDVAKNSIVQNKDNIIDNTLNTTLQNINEEKVKKLESYSLLDMYNKDNIEKIQKTADYINNETLKSDSNLNKYADQVGNISEKILTNTFFDIKNKTENKITETTGKEISLDNKQIQDTTVKIYEEYKEKAVNQISASVNTDNIKNTLKEKTSFIDQTLLDIKNFIDQILNKKQESLEIKTEKVN